jgi:hypothetical protein
MSHPISKPSERSAGPRTEFGEVEAMFSPSRGQTMAGVMAGLGIIIAGWLLALNDSMPIRVQAFYAAGGTIGGLGIALWTWRLRRWRLLVCADGLIQVGAWKRQALRWTEVMAVIETRDVRRPAGPPVALCFIGRQEKINVTTYTLRSWKEMLEVVSEAARRRCAVIRVELTGDST